MSFRGIYDYDFMDYTVRVLRKCKEYGFKVYMDPHQDVVGILLVRHISLSVLTTESLVVSLFGWFRSALLDSYRLWNESSQFHRNESGNPSLRISGSA